MTTIQDYKGARILQILTDTIPAGKTKRINAVGKIIAMDSSTDVLSIQTDQGTKHILNAGAVEIVDDSALYESITISNDTAGDITYTIYYGFGDYVGTRKLITGAVTVSGSALPTGASTAAKQDTGNTSLGSIDTKLPALSGGKVPVIDAAAETSLASIDTKAATAIAEDTASAGGEKGIPALLVRRDAPAAETSADGDFSTPVADKFGAQIIRKQGTTKRTYSAAFQIAPAAAPTDVFQIVGAANRLVEITDIVVGGVQTTAGQMLAFLIKRSAANTGGTATNPTAVPHDASDAAALAVIKNYSANPSGLGATVGNILARRFPIGAAISLISSTVIEFGETGRCPTLNSATEALCLNLNGVTLTGGTLEIEITWTETTV